MTTELSKQSEFSLKNAFLWVYKHLLNIDCSNFDEILGKLVSMLLYLFNETMHIYLVVKYIGQYTHICLRAFKYEIRYNSTTYETKWGGITY